MERLSLRLCIFITFLVGILEAYALSNQADNYLVLIACSLIFLIALYLLIFKLDRLFKKYKENIKQVYDSVYSNQNKQVELLEKLVEVVNESNKLIIDKTEYIVDENKNLATNIIGSSEKEFSGLKDNIEKNSSKIVSTAQAIEVSMDARMHEMSEEMKSQEAITNSILEKNNESLLAMLRDNSNSINESIANLKDSETLNIAKAVEAMISEAKASKEVTQIIGERLNESIVKLQENCLKVAGDIIEKQTDLGKSLSEDIKAGVNVVGSTLEEMNTELKNDMVDLNRYEKEMNEKIMLRIGETSENHMSELNDKVRLLSTLVEGTVTDSQILLINELHDLREELSKHSLENEGKLDNLTDSICSAESKIIDENREAMQIIGERLNENIVILQENCLKAAADIIEKETDLGKNLSEDIKAGVNIVGSTLEEMNTELKNDMVDLNRYEKEMNEKIMLRIGETSENHMSELSDKVKLLSTLVEETVTDSQILLINELHDLREKIGKNGLENGEKLDNLMDSICSAESKIIDGNLSIKETLMKQNGEVASILNSRTEAINRSLKESTESLASDIENEANVLRVGIDEIKSSINDSNDKAVDDIKSLKTTVLESAEVVLKNIEQENKSLRIDISRVSEKNISLHNELNSNLEEEIALLENSNRVREKRSEVKADEINKSLISILDVLNTRISKLYDSIDSKLSENAGELKSEIALSTLKEINFLKEELIKMINRGNYEIYTKQLIVLEDIKKHITFNSEDLEKNLKFFINNLRIIQISHELHADKEAAATSTTVAKKGIGEERKVEEDGITKIYRGSKLIKSVNREDGSEVLFDYSEDVLIKTRTMVKNKLAYEMFLNDRGQFEKGLEYVDGNIVNEYLYYPSGELKQRTEFKYNKGRLTGKETKVYNEKGEMINANDK